MAKELKTAEAPKIEIVFAANAQQADLADCYLVPHAPDGNPPVTVLVDGGPFDMKSGMELVQEMWAAIGKRFAVPTAKFGMIQPKRNLDG